MRKVLTAIGNPRLHKKLKEIEDCQVLGKDITNDEELIENLEREENVEFLFLGSGIITHYKVDEFIKIIRKLQTDINLIFFQGENIESTLKEDDHLKIYTSFELDGKFLEEIFQKARRKRIQTCTSKVIAISGASGVGKSTFSTFLAKNVEDRNIKTLLIDFDLEQNQIRTLLKIKKQPQYAGDTKELVINVTKNLDVLCHLDCVFPNKDEMNYFEIQEIINQLKEEYDLILIDTSSKLENEYTKRIFYNSDKVIFLLEPNILGVKKSKNMLEVIENDWKIANSKMKIVVNKSNMYQISDAILQELFPDIELLGKMRYMDSYNLMINKSVDKREIRREYERIYRKIYNFK